MENPIERDVKLAEVELRRQLETDARAVGDVAPVGKRLLTRREKFMRSMDTPARAWTPAQAEFMLRETLRVADGGRY